MHKTSPKIFWETIYDAKHPEKLAANRIAKRKLHDKQTRRAQIISASRRIAELEGSPHDDAATSPELRFAFSELMALFQGQSSKPEVISELFWASLHRIAERTRIKRFPRSRHKERVRALVELFSFSRD